MYSFPLYMSWIDKTVPELGRLGLGGWWEVTHGFTESKH